MAGIVPRPDQIEALASRGMDEPIVMINLLKYRARAEYDAERPEAQENLSGRDAYQRYGMAALQHVTALGGRVVWGGQQKLVMIGDSETNDWDDIVCVMYPSREAFLKMTHNPEYLAAHYHREAGLERTALLCCSAGTAA